MAREAGATMMVYLAGPSAELPRVREAAAQIEAAGHVITGRWWEKVADGGVCASDTDHPEPILAAAADRNARGIDTADVVIALCREAGGLSPGVAHEVGYAQGICTSVVFVGNASGHLAPRWPLGGDVAETVAGALAILGAL